MKKRINSSAGFTLMESVIAIGVVAILLTTFLAVFGPATQTIRRSISGQEANRLQFALEREFRLLRDGTDGNYESAFEKAFDWIKDVEAPVFLYNYRGDPTDVRSDGSLEPYTDASGQSGRDYVLQAAVRRLGDADRELEEDLEAVEGPVYYVRMTQLVYDDGELTISDKPAEIVDPFDGGAYTNASDYTQGLIAFSAEFYVLRSNKLDYLESLELSDGDGDGRPDALGNPLFTRNLGVRR